jgi:hypothetical protein
LNLSVEEAHKMIFEGRTEKVLIIWEESWANIAGFVKNHAYTSMHLNIMTLKAEALYNVENL